MIHLMLYVTIFPLEKNKSLSCLPSTSNIVYGQILRLHHVVLVCSNLLSKSEAYLDPARFNWSLVDSVLIYMTRNLHPHI